MSWQEDWNEHLWPNYGTPPICLSHGRGHEVWDRDGNRYVDLLAGIAVSSLGHAHPAMVQAVQEQVERLTHTSNLYANEPCLELAKALATHAPDHRVFFCNSGAEANEAALKLVRRHAHEKGQTGTIVAFANSFHGRSTGALALTGQRKYRTGFGAVPKDIIHVPFDDPKALIQAAHDHGPIIGIFAEPIQGEGGIIPMSTAMVDAIKSLQAEGAVLVMDEVQTGVGRTGGFFAHTALGLRPDIITLAKGLGGGLPIGATLALTKLAKLMTPGTHGSTFGGNPISAAAACAVLQTLENENLTARARRLHDTAQAIMAEAKIEIRGAGLLLGVPHASPSTVVDAMRAQGILVGVAGQTVRLAPPLTISEEAWIQSLHTLVDVLRSTVTIGSMH